MKYLNWQAIPGRFRSMTGYDVSEFNGLLPYFKEAHQQYLYYYQMDGSLRQDQREHVIYSNSPLPCVEERLAFTCLI